MQKNLNLVSVVTVAMIAAIPAAQAQDAPSENQLRLSLGAGAAPDYLGADEYKFIPLPGFEAKYEGFTLRSSGLGVEADLVPFLGFDAGPILRYDMGRNDMKDNVVAKLPEIDGTFEVGGFIGFGVPLNYSEGQSPTILTARLEATKGASGGHDGALLSGSLGLVHPLSEQFTAIASVSATYMNSDYAETYFSIDSAGSTASGLPAFDADPGIRDVGAGLVLNYQFTEALSMFGIARYTKLLGDAQDSPIVAIQGSDNQVFGGIGVSYTFK